VWFHRFERNILTDTFNLNTRKISKITWNLFEERSFEIRIDNTRWWILDKIFQEKIPQYEIYPDIIPQYKIPQEIIPESEKKDKIPHNKTTFHHNNLLHSSRAHWYKLQLEFKFQWAPCNYNKKLMWSINWGIRSSWITCIEANWNMRSYSTVGLCPGRFRTVGFCPVRFCLDTSVTLSCLRMFFTSLCTQYSSSHTFVKN